MPTDEIYWNSIDFGSEESLQEPPSLSNYVDPWDLENYAYIREHLGSTDLDSYPTSSDDFLAAVNSTSFHYVPSHREQNYAAIEEVTEYKNGPRRRQQQAYSDGGMYKTDFDNEFDENPYELTLKESSYSYGNKGKWRRISKQPSDQRKFKDRSLSFSFGDVMGQDIYSKLDQVVANSDTTSPIYDDVKNRKKTPRNFGLSSYGHLKIDYSYNWNKLDKYICN